MTGILAANALFLAIGVGLLPLLRIARTRAELVERLGLAYLAGLAATGILAAHLALIDVPVGLVELVLLAAAALFFGLRRVGTGGLSPEGTVPTRVPRQKGSDPFGVRPQHDPAWSRVLGGGALAVCLVLLARAWSTYEIRPLLEWDGWAIWGTRARALYEFGGATGPVFTSEAYLPLQHPLLLPAVEAIAFRAMGVHDATLVHVQLALLAFGFLAAFVALLRNRVPAFLVGLVALALLAAEPVLKHLSTNLADVPLALFVALGLVGAGRWLATDERWALHAAALFLGAAALTKSEGIFFALVALVALGAASWPRWREVAGAAAAVALVVLPWRLFVTLHDLPLVEYDFADALSPSYLADESGRVDPAVRGLGGEIFTLEWGLLPLLFAASLVGAVLARRYALAAFAAAWVALAFAGLVLVYWISTIPIDLALVWSGDRTIITIVFGAAALSALLGSATSAAASGRR